MPKTTEQHRAHADAPDATSSAQRLLAGPLEVVNVGLESFANELAAAGHGATHVDWVPPAGGDPVLADLLAKLDG